MQNGDSLIRIESPLHIDYENVSNARIQSTQVVYRDVDTYVHGEQVVFWVTATCLLLIMTNRSPPTLIMNVPTLCLKCIYVCRL